MGFVAFEINCELGFLKRNTENADVLEGLKNLHSSFVFRMQEM